MRFRAILVAGSVLAIFAFYGEIMSLLSTWESQEEYSHGFIIPFIAAFMMYQKRHEFRQFTYGGSWAGALLVVSATLLCIAGRMAVVSTMGQYAFVLSIAGLLLALLGWKAFKVILPAVVLLAFMVKLPTFIFNNLSGQLQLISSEIGVWFIRLFNISVYLEGNVIDLGMLKLQVVEACSGLRYLFPLMALSYILANFYRAPFVWKALLFVSSMPVTVLMNSFRIGAIGVTVEYWGKKMAEGFLHDFEGWVVFMAAFIVLLLEILIFNWIRRDSRSLAEVLYLGGDDADTTPETVETQRIPRPFYLSMVVLMLFVGVNQTLSISETVYPQREQLSHFPMWVDGRLGTASALEPIYLNALQVDDYLLADYRSAGSTPVNLYVAYYNVQAEGAGTIHSPRSCLPGSGWQIKSISQEDLADVIYQGKALHVNRAVIAKDDQQLLVYYWMQQRGRIITNEFMAKWWIFWDRLTRGRSDGALVRVMTEIDQFGDVGQSDIKLHRFVQNIMPQLPRFIPD